ncbi:hypothetical protein BQ8794_240221 [Mesorhizobium prunaredense]|uniref:Uncharacterized protein n=1 Tax=Mesorhizobium prunaredense TaxID=1631249 RepID=A0A1R3V816_9HYPH|nr:hypothetical protein BQ8794_240221 [Mesorhizobium prunaredense]
MVLAARARSAVSSWYRLLAMRVVARPGEAMARLGLRNPQTRLSLTWAVLRRVLSTVPVSKQPCSSFP